ncbi:DUF1972 domain-containing protein [Methylobacterium oryzae]|uniref:DUF1972 domain-containing protein n=1 Tax=Methylobacterium oryzae TaxID=334852 RepID=UPI002F35BCCA
MKAGGSGGRPAVAILGTRGVPAAHGGFETLAERLALELVARGWRVEVYCQVREPAPPTVWRGITLIPVAVRGDGAVSTIVFDLRCTLRAAFRPALPLVLGYNTAVFSLLYRLTGKRSVMNMDGIEWKRDRWSRPAKAWFWLNERLGSLFSTHLVADHPEIARHLARGTSSARITTIAYGADPVVEAPTAPLAKFGLRTRDYGLLIARVVPENLVLQIVRAWSEVRPGLPLLVLGKLAESDPYHRAVQAAGGPDVIFAGAIYEAERVAALRFHARFHIHGHTVGGTNPSLVEALGAGSPILAHDNPFNRWVAGPQALYFGDETELRQGILGLVRAGPRRLAVMGEASRRRHAEAFTWRGIFDAYERVLRRQLAPERAGRLPLGQHRHGTGRDIPEAADPDPNRRARADGDGPLHGGVRADHRAVAEAGAVGGERLVREDPVPRPDKCTGQERELGAAGAAEGDTRRMRHEQPGSQPRARMQGGAREPQRQVGHQGGAAAPAPAVEQVRGSVEDRHLHGRQREVHHAAQP